VGDRGLTAIRTRGFEPFLIHPGPKERIHPGPKERDAQLLSLTDVISCATRKKPPGHDIDCNGHPCSLTCHRK
jgi:hypothetical protein